MNDARSKGTGEWDFLLNEYHFLTQYLVANYEERDRYVNFHTVLLTAIAAGVGFAIDKGNWVAVLLLALVSGVLSYFALLKVLYQRVVVTEYKNRLNLTRGRLRELSGCGPQTQSILLPTTACVKYLKTSGGDAALHRILGFVTAASAGGALLVLGARILPSFRHQQVVFTAAALFVFIVFLVILDRKWKNILKERDQALRQEEENSQRGQPLTRDKE